MAGWLSYYKDGGEVSPQEQLRLENAKRKPNQQLKWLDESLNEPSITNSKSSLEQFVKNIAGAWRENKPQLMKDVPLTDLTVGPILDYISGSSDVAPMVFGNVSNAGQLMSVGNKARRMLAQESKWVDQSPSLKGYLETASKRHNPASFYDPQKLGRNTGTYTEISKLSRLSDTNKARVAAHEVGHYYQNAPIEADEWNSLFDFSKLSNKSQKYLKGKPIYESVTPNPTKGFQLDKEQGKMLSKAQGNEIRERAGQLKDYIAQKNNIRLDKDFKITETQLDDAIQNYTSETGLDNNMTQLLSSLKDKKGLLSLMNKYALGAIPTAAMVDYKNGGELNYNDSSVSLPQRFIGDGYYSPMFDNGSKNGQFENGGEISTSGKVRDFLHKTIGVPMAINQLGYDVSGGQSPITENSLTDEELNYLRGITRSNLKEGKNTISYGDYNKTGSKDTEGWEQSLRAIKDIPTNMKYTLGRARIDINKGDTTIIDKYNFDDKIKNKSFGNHLKSAKEIGIKDPYNQARNLGTYFGSDEQHGSPVNIKINQKENGGELKKLDQLTNFNQFGQDKKWLKQYK